MNAPRRTLLLLALLSAPMLSMAQNLTIAEPGPGVKPYPGVPTPLPGPGIKCPPQNIDIYARPGTAFIPPNRRCAKPPKLPPVRYPPIRQPPIAEPMPLPYPTPSTGPGPIRQPPIIEPIPYPTPGTTGPVRGPVTMPAPQMPMPMFPGPNLPPTK